MNKFGFQIVPQLLQFYQRINQLLLISFAIINLNGCIGYLTCLNNLASWKPSCLVFFSYRSNLSKAIRLVKIETYPFIHLLALMYFGQQNYLLWLYSSFIIIFSTIHIFSVTILISSFFHQEQLKIISFQLIHQANLYTQDFCYSFNLRD